MKPKYRIRKVVSDLGDRYYPEQRGLLWGWNSVYLYVQRINHIGGTMARVEYDYISARSMSFEDAKACIDYRIAQDNERETIIDYP